MKYLKKIHKIVLFIGIFMTIIVAKNQVEEVYANNSVVCNPVLIRKCSICGNNYDNSEECPHHVNEMYHGDICSPAPGRVCNICGGNYDDGNECPHHEGEEYGGKECDAYEGRLCNICGYNYDDGSVCPHKSGQRYNGDTCYILETRLCNICGKNYDNPDECPHKIGTIYEDIIYIFYISASRNVADIQKTMLSDYYGLSQENIVLKEICSQQDYINAWNEMGSYNGQLYNVLLVNITMHGGALWMGEQNGTQYVTPYVIKWKLESKKVETVLLVSCDVGNVDYSTTNIAANIAKKTEGGIVIASDGTVQFSTPGFGSPYYYSSVYDSYFYNECINKGRDNRGWLLYRYENERIEISAGKGKKLKIEQILGLVA